MQLHMGWHIMQVTALNMHIIEDLSSYLITIISCKQQFLHACVNYFTRNTVNRPVCLC